MSKRLKRPLVGIIFSAICSLLYVGIIVIAPHKASANDLPVVHVSGQLVGNQTWTSGYVYAVDSPLTIPNNVTLTIEAGAIVKYAAGSTNRGINVDGGGSLQIEGTDLSPVIITSIKDDSAGGDSNNDGASSGSPGDYGVAISPSGSAEVVVEHALFRNGNLTLENRCPSSESSVAITDSVLENGLKFSGCDPGNIVLQRNEFDVSGRAIQADYMDVTGIALAGLAKNTFNGTGQKSSIYMYGSNVPSGKVWTVDGSSNAVLNITSLSVTGTMNLQQGSIAKIEGNNGGISVQNGTLNITGTAGDPIIFTSYKDDSIGGDTNNDGASAGSTADYSTAIRPSGTATVAIEHTVFHHGSRAIGSQCTNNNAVSITATDSLFNSGIQMAGCTPGTLNLSRNEFNPNIGFAISAWYIDPSDIILEGPDKNSFTGANQGKGISLYGAFIPDGKTWAISGSSNAVVNLVSSLTVDGALQLQPGAIFKHEQPGKLVVSQGGSITAIGSAAMPVVFTSYKDDSVAGDTNNDGPSSGALADASTAIYNDGGSVSLDSAIIKYFYNALWSGHSASETLFNATVIDTVNTALQVPYGHAIFRGSITGISNRGVLACNWGQSCSVDAAYVDWGSATGPFVPSGTDLVCGSVTVSPWKVGSATGEADTFGVKNCGGSSTPSQRLSTKVDIAHQAVASKRIDCDYGIQDACDAIETYLACLSSAIQLASSQSPIPVTFDNPTETVDTIASTTANASNAFLQGLESESVTSFNLGVATGMLNVVNLYDALSNAYDTCAP